MKIFWSWQSDTHQPYGRYFVRDVIAELCADLSSGVAYEEAARPEDNLEGDQVVEIDHDTLGVGGSPPISETILRKIKEAAVFVADVTPICITSSGKRVPNPNVMIELGYALSVLGNERIVLVMNSADGAALEYLPFDLRHWRAPAQYSLAKDTNKTNVREQAKVLKRVLRQRIEPGLKLAKAASAVMAKTPERMPELRLELQSSQQYPMVISQALDFGSVKSLEIIKMQVPLLLPSVENRPSG